VSIINSPRLSDSSSVVARLGINQSAIVVSQGWKGGKGRCKAQVKKGREEDQKALGEIVCL
jgi:hypothetical protein